MTIVWPLILGAGAMRALLLAGVTVLGLAGTANASLIGNTVGVTLDFPNKSTVYQDYGTTTVTSAIEFTGVDQNAQTVDFQANSIVISNVTGIGFAFESFNGLVFSDYSANFTSAVLDPASTQTGLSASMLSVSSGVIYFNESGEGLSAGKDVVIDVTTAGAAALVPEPASLTLLGTCLFGLIAARGRRQGK